MSGKPEQTRAEAEAAARTLAAALPYMKRYARQTIVVKYGEIGRAHV